MNRFWAGLPIAVMAAVPLWTETSAAVIVIETVAILLCVIGVLRGLLVAVTTGAVCATTGYAVALWLENTGVWSARRFLAWHCCSCWISANLRGAFMAPKSRPK